MNRPLLCLGFSGLLLAAAPLGSRCADGATLTVSAFIYNGDTFTIAGRREKAQPTEGHWNPALSKANPSVRAPGFHVSFFGHGTGCPANSSNGPLATLPTDLAARAGDLTGIVPDARGYDLSWTPMWDPAVCGRGDNLTPGPAFVVAREGLKGGVGLFTDAGDGGPIAGPHFWQPFTKTGQNGAGANQSIEGTFIAWKFDWRHKDAVAPWSGDGPGSSSEPRVLLRSTQSVPTAAAHPSTRGVGPVQVKQQYAATFVNPTCLGARSKGRVCQIRYMFHTALVRADGLAGSQERSLSQAHLLLDPAQNGLPVFYGPLKASGQAANAGAPALDLWRSRGSQTQRAPFRNKTFVAEISFREFQNGLRVIAARMLAVSPPRVQEQELAKWFGPAWNDPRAWLLADVNVGQEVYSDGTEAYIGGSVTRLDAIALPR